MRRRDTTRTSRQTRCDLSAVEECFLYAHRRPVFVRVLDSLRRRAAEVPEVDRSASLRPHQAALAQEEGPAGENCKTKLFFPSFDYITN